MNVLASPMLIKLGGYAGSLLVLLAVVLPGLAYRGRAGERYSIFNHYISELGELGVSRLARVFNAGMIAAGIIYLPMCLGLGLRLPGWWSKAGMLAGLVAAVALALVGVFPMNNLKAHGRVALLYFRSALVMLIFFSIAILLQARGQDGLPRWALGPSLLAALCYAAFLVFGNEPEKEPGIEPANAEGPLAVMERPAFWHIAALEWSVFASSIIWFFTTALAV